MGFGKPAPLCPTCLKSVFANEQQIGPGGKVSSLLLSFLSSILREGRSTVEGWRANEECVGMA